LFLIASHPVFAVNNTIQLSFPKKAENALAFLHIWLTSRKKNKNTKSLQNSSLAQAAQINLYNWIVFGKKWFHRYFLALNPLFPPG